MSKNDETKILLDSDVVRHFLSGKQLDKLSKIFPNRFVMLDRVQRELYKSTKLIGPIGEFITKSKIEIVPFPEDMQIIMEYAYLRRQFGEGESACMAVARYKKQYIASSNLNDIKAFCKTHGIVYYTTMDILQEAIEKKVMTENECDIFINDVKAMGSRLPCNSMAEYEEIKNRS